MSIGQERNLDSFESPDSITLPRQSRRAQETMLGSTYSYNPTKTKIIIVVLLLFVVLVAGNWLAYSATDPDDPHIDTGASPVAKGTTLLPRILWIYSDNEFDSLQFTDQTMANYLIGKGEEASYEVRRINHTSAYDWMSSSMAHNITQARNKVRVEVGIEDLLVLGILIQNGGIFMRKWDSLLVDGFQWIQQGFTDYKGHDKQWSCPADKGEVFLVSEQLKVASFSHYSDSFIAARTNSTLLRSTMDMYIKISTTEPDINGPYNWILQPNTDTLAYGAPDLLQYSMSLVVNKQLQRQKRHEPLREQDSPCAVLGLLTLKANDYVLDVNYLPEHQLRPFITQREHVCPSKLKLLIQVNRGIITDIIVRTMRKMPLLLEEGSLMHQVLHSRGNKEILIDELPPKQIDFCIVTLQQISSEDQIEGSMAMLSVQSYQRWTAVYLVKDEASINRGQLSYRSKIMSNTGNKGLNIEQALTKHCPHKSYAVLLNKYERFEHPGVLAQLALDMKPRGVLGAVVTLKVDGEERIPHNAKRNFYRKHEGIVNPDLPRMKEMLNHLRVFSVEAYKFLPQFDLRDSYGNYYEDRLIFIMSFYDMVRDALDSDVDIYTVRKYAPKFDIPQKIVLSENAVITTNIIDEIDMDQMKRTFTRLETQSMRVVVDSLNQFRISFDKMLTFNEGRPFENFQSKKGPLLIQPIIHQAWLGGEMPLVKRYLFEKTAEMFPEYQMKLWSLQNITEENFPFTYQILKTLCEFNRYSPYNKYATMTDILRHEALYHHGGFWKDSSMNFLKPVLNDFRKYKLVIATDKTMRHRYLQGMCFYGHVKHYEPAMRINSFKHLNRMRVYQAYPFDIAGPVDFRRIIDKDEQYDPQILVLSYQTFYPGQLGQHPAGDMCTQEVNDKPHERYESIKDNWGILKNCSQIYPYAFGIEHNRYGVTWLWKTGNNRQNQRECQIK